MSQKNSALYILRLALTLLAITAARRGLPLSALWEMVLLLLVFELLKEAGTL